MGTPITMAKNNILVEECQAGAGLSESFLNRLGAGVNFINGRHYERHTWNLNGPYYLHTGQYVDGSFICPFDMELVCFSMSVADVKTDSSTSSTSVDLYRKVGNASPTDITSTRAKVHSSAGDLGFVAGSWINTDGTLSTGDPPVTHSIGTSCVMPIFTTKTFNQFDSIWMKCNSVSGKPEGLTVSIWFRPV